ncbi:PREDICTED: uncharacterized protein LOC109341170 [Lupinus angustifolius]|uniref:uncharacterized protein LOC109341170 n=1 Tax=Lupinus angustifolius TaxID=3871 RepID=UPI00092FBA33|nr:PREDICTED: uncharacterized protein LOC109341170 [Lupinus angustifolius]
MKVIFGYQEVLDIVANGVTSLAENPTEEQRVQHKENMKNDCKALCLIHQCVDNVHFKKIVGAVNSSEAWTILEQGNEGVDQLKKVRLQTMRRQFELTRMEDTERVAEFFNGITTLTNAMKSCGEKIHDLTIVEKVLCTLTPKFDHIVVAIEESRKLENMKIEELQGSLEAHEQRIIERSGGKIEYQTLQAHTFRRKWSYGRGGDSKGRGRGREIRENIRSGTLVFESPRRGGHKGSYGSKRRMDKSKSKCYNCGRLGYFSNECQFPAQTHETEKQGDEVNMA